MLILLLNIAVELYTSEVPQHLVVSAQQYQYQHDLNAKITNDIVEEIQIFTPQPSNYYHSVGASSLAYNPYDATHISKRADNIYSEDSFDEILPDDYAALDGNGNNNTDSSAYARNLRVYYEDEVLGATTTNPSPSENTEGSGQSSLQIPYNSMTSNSAQQNAQILGDGIITPADYHPPQGSGTSTGQTSSVNYDSLPNAPTQQFALTIDKIGLKNIPILHTDIYNKDIWFEDLKKGIGQFLQTPGKGHKVGLFGHSSNYSWVNSNYNYVFKDLNTLQTGDIVYLDYGGKRFTYKVSKKEITGPFVPSVVTDYNREELVMFTCWPYMTSKNRLIVYAEPQF